MKYSTQMLSQAYPSDEIDSLPQSPMALDLPGLLSFAPSASCSAVPEICNPDSDNWAPATSVIADSDKSIPSSKASQKRKPRVPKVDTVKFVLKHLHDTRISLMDLLFTILSGDDFDWYRLRFLSDSRRINDLLNLLWNNKKSKPIFGDWFKDHGIDHICNLVSREMEAAKPMLKMDLKEVSPEFLEHWDLNSIMDPVVSVTPTWSKLLHAATEPSKKKVEIGSDPRNHLTVCFRFIFFLYLLRNGNNFSDQEHDSRFCSLSLLTCLLQSSDWYWPYCVGYWCFTSNDRYTSSIRLDYVLLLSPKSSRITFRTFLTNCLGLHQSFSPCASL